VAATVRAITHVRSLITESDVKAPGDRPQMLGVRSVYSYTAISLRRLLDSIGICFPVVVLPVAFGSVPAVLHGNKKKF